MAYATFDTVFYSHTRAAVFDTISSLQCSDGGVIAASEVNELLGYMICWTVLCQNGMLIKLLF